MATNDSVIERAAEVDATFRIRDGLYLLGACERGVTLYNQQVRAHNLIWALWELDRAEVRKVGSVAVIGSGAAGLTATAGLLALFGGSASVTLFERLWDLCPLQQGSDTRWLHPRIYEWPRRGSRAPSASLPILNWSEGRASDVARTLVREFGEYCEQFATRPESFAVYLGLRNFQLQAGTRDLEWVGTRAERVGPFFRRGSPEGNAARFDTVILATGFGLERESPTYQTESYWRNEQIAQPILDGNRRSYVISGYGDGALVDLCRLTIERFRQDTIVYELFGGNLEEIENRMRTDLERIGPSANLFPYFRSIDQELLVRAHEQLSARVRKDTAVTLHIGGKDGAIRSLSEIFGPTSSRLNRLLTYLLHRAGAFSTCVSDLDDCVCSHHVPVDAVLCRHGADTKGYLRAIIGDYESIEARLDEMWGAQGQKSVRLWEPGAYPVTQQGSQR